MDCQKYTNKQIENFICKSVMDNMHACIYVTDIDTDEILYMNDHFKETFGLKNPEGSYCWQVLQSGMKGRCPFCPVEKLVKQGEGSRGIRWEEHNTLTGKTYENYDCLIRWIDGRLVHLQQSSDAGLNKEWYKFRNSDDLTRVFTRRAGKLIMTEKVFRAKEQRLPVTVALLDLNDLKSINDNYGHREGDRALVYITQASMDNLEHEDIIFRLSGDEFVICFYGANLLKAAKTMEKIKGQLEKDDKCNCLPYEVSFCYGLTESSPEDTHRVEELISRADEAMYIQKRRYHIEKAQKMLNQPDEGLLAQIQNFQYDKEHLYEALIESTDEYIYIGNMKTGTFRYAPNMVKEFDLPGQIVPNAAAVWGALIHPMDKQAFLEANQEIADGRADMHNVEYRARNRFGEWIWMRCRGYLIRDEFGNPNLFAGMITNLGKKNRIDNLSGLYNKYQLKDEVRRHIKDYPNVSFGVMMLDIDDFKHVNGLYNREFGDEVIRITSQRIYSSLTSDASVFRMDGDEFCILVKNGQEQQMQSIYNKIQHMFEKQQEYDGKKYYCTLSAGCSVYPDDGEDYLSLIKKASYALEYTKDRGKNCMTVFRDEIMKHRERKFKLTDLLREGVETDFKGFSVDYQPLVMADTGQMVGAEALMRWKSGNTGPVSPAEFIPILEQSGLIIPAGRWIFRQAVRQCKKWMEKCPGFVMSINLSYLQIIQPDFLVCVRETLQDAEVPFENIVLELTENYYIKEQERIKIVFKNLQNMGVKVAMDDFGTGYSSLGVLRDMPVDLVKIDQAFVKNVEKDTFNETFIRFIVTLCHDVEKEVCLEGVETEEEYGIVRKNGLEFIQGYYFGHPSTPEEFEIKYMGR